MVCSSIVLSQACVVFTKLSKKFEFDGVKWKLNIPLEILGAVLRGLALYPHGKSQFGCWV